MNLVEGEILAGKFRIERVIGRGGMGVVVAATHVQLGERVALKFLLPEALHNPEAVERFAREARAAVRIKSEHVARVSDVGMLENGAPYMVMEYLNGSDLSVWLAQRGPLPIEQAVEFLLQACEALTEAHAMGIVHRDLKPANLFVIERPDGTLSVKVLDFGISKALHASTASAGVTSTSAIMGSPLYMSPEQMQSAKTVDPRGDIWALGVVLYELISGRPPFPGQTMAELVLKVVTGSPVPLGSVCPNAPAKLEAVILRCLQKEREQRYQNIGELAVTLVEFAPRRSRNSVQRIANIMQRAGMATSGLQLPVSSARVAAEAADVEPTRPIQTLASWGQTNPPSSDGRRVARIAAAFIALAVLAVGGLAVHRSRTPTASLASASAASASVAALKVQVAVDKPIEVQPRVDLMAATPASAAPSATQSAAPPLPAPLLHAHIEKIVLPSIPPSSTIPIPSKTPTDPPSRAATSEPPALPTPPHSKNPLKMV